MIRSPALTASSTLTGSKPCSMASRPLARVLAVGDDDFDAAVAQVQGVGVALRSEADDGDGLAFEGVKRGVLFVHHLQRLGHNRFLAINRLLRVGQR